MSIENFLKKHKKALLYFSAKWCSPCKSMKPIIEKLQRGGMNLMVIDIEDESAAPFLDLCHVQSVPTIIKFVDAMPVGQLGVASESKIEEFYL